MKRRRIVIERILIHVAQLCAQRSAEVEAGADEGTISVRSGPGSEVGAVKVYENFIVQRYGPDLLRSKRLLFKSGEREWRYGILT